MKLSVMLAPAPVALGLLASLTAHAAEGDPAAGKKVFNVCRACHEAETDKNKVGPSLHGVVGRTAGTLPSYEAKYSPAMKEAGKNGMVWDEAHLTDYLRNPKAVIPKGKMAFPGLKKDEDLANVIAYLKANSQP